MVRGAFAFAVVVSLMSAPARAANPDCDRFKKSGTPDSYLESTFDQQMNRALGCSKSDWSTEKKELKNLAYLLDLPGAEESQILSARFVEQCLNHTRISDGNDDWLFCGYDARRLDDKKLETEIASRKLSPESATAARALFKTAKGRAALMVDDLTTKQKSSSYDLKQIFIDLPEAAAVAWQKLYADHKDVYDLGTSIERQLSASDRGQRGYQIVQVKGCAEMHKALKDYLSSTQKGKMAPEIAQFVQSDPVAFEMMSSLSACDGLGGFKVDAAGEYELIRAGRMWRGPRMAGYWAAVTAAMDIQAKTSNSSPVHREGGSINDNLLLYWAKDIFETNFTIERDPDTAKVATVKKLSPGWVEITFKVEKWMEPDFECVDVKPLHFNHWGAQGQAVYDWTCKIKGYHEEKKEFAPRAFSEAAAAGIKPGMTVKMTIASQDKDPKKQAFPLEVSLPAKTKKDKPKLLSFSSIPL